MVLKYFLISILLLSSLAANSNYVLLSGYAYHFDEYSITGEEYNSAVIGLGYQHRRPCEMLMCSASVMALNDSNHNMMYSGSLGVAYPLSQYMHVGIEGGLASRVVYGVTTSATEVTITPERQPIGFAMPKVEFFYKKLMVAVSYIPKITGNIETSAVIYTTIGIKL